MPTYRLDEALTRIEHYVTDVGDTVEDADVDRILSFDHEDDETYWLRGHRCSMDDHSYLVVGNERLRFLGVLYTYDLRSAVRMHVDHELDEATDELFSEIDPERLDDLTYRLQKLSAGSDCLVDFLGDDTRPNRLVVERQIFPYERAFGVSDFASAKDSVVRLGSLAKRGVERAITVDVDEQTPTETTVSVSPDRI
ncbi:MAG: hypothetical protein ABEI99_00620 [Halobaculum sp.]